MARMAQKPEEGVARMEAVLAEARRATAALEQQIALAKGTREVPEAGSVASVRPAEPTKVTLEAKIEAVLRAASLDVIRLAAAVKEPEKRVQSAINRLTKAGQVANVNSVNRPVWIWCLGDNGTTEELNQVVFRLLSERPMTTQELSDVTGARYARVSGAVVWIQQHPVYGRRITDHLGAEGRAKLWFVLPAEPRYATLEPRSSKRRRKRAGQSDEGVGGSSG